MLKDRKTIECEMYACTEPMHTLECAKVGTCGAQLWPRTQTVVAMEYNCFVHMFGEHGTVVFAELRILAL